MKKWYGNTNDYFGDYGPWEAESKFELVVEMRPTLKEWARQAQWRGDNRDLQEILDEMEANYELALEEVTE